MKMISSLLNTKPRLRLALLSPLPEEIEFVLQAFGNKQSHQLYLGEFQFSIYHYHNAEILIAPTGFGTTFTANAITLIHYFFQPQYILLIGTAGAVKKEVQIGDIVIAEQAFEAEILNLADIVKSTPFEKCFFHPFKKKTFSPFYSANQDLINILAMIEVDAPIHLGMVATSNTFPAPIELFKKIKKLETLCIDMETSALYQTAWLLNLKVLAIRGISNKLDPNGEDNQLQEADISGSMKPVTGLVIKLIDKIAEINTR